MLPPSTRSQLKIPINVFNGTTLLPTTCDALSDCWFAFQGFLNKQASSTTHTETSSRWNKTAEKIISFALGADDFNIHFFAECFFSLATCLLLSEGNFIMIQWHFSLLLLLPRGRSLDSPENYSDAFFGMESENIGTAAQKKLREISIF